MRVFERDMHVKLHGGGGGGGCLAWHDSDAVPVPRRTFQLSAASACHLEGEGQHTTLHVTVNGCEDSRRQQTAGQLSHSDALRVSVSLRAATPSDEVEQPPPAAVVLAEWHQAESAEVTVYGHSVDGRHHLHSCADVGGIAGVFAFVVFCRCAAV